LLFVSYSFYGQKYFYNHYTIDDGLPINQVYDISESPTGIITFGTDNGISFFDGIQFHNLTTKNGLNKPYVISAKYYKNNELLIGNYNGLFQIYNKGKFYTTKIPCNTVYEVFLKDKSVIICQNTSNIFKETKETILSYFYDYYQKNTPKKHYDLYSNFALNELKKNKTYNEKLIRQNIPIFSIGIESYWVDSKIHHPLYPITIPAEINGVYMIKKRQNDWVLFSENDLYIVGFDSKIIQKIKLPFSLFLESNRFCAEIDKNDKIWLNLQKRGLFILDQDRWHNVEHFIDLKPNQNINKLFKDSKGRMWIATHENGVYCIPNTDVIHYYSSNYENYFNSFFVNNNQVFTGNRYGMAKVHATHLEAIPLPKSNEFKLGYFENHPTLLGFQPNYHRKKVYENSLAIQYRDYCKLSENEYLFYSKQELFHEKNLVKKFVSPEKEGQNYYYNIINHKNQLIVNTGNEIFSVRLIENPIYHNKILYKHKKLQRIKTIYQSKGFVPNIVFKNDTLLLSENNALVYFKDKVLKKINQINGYSFENINKIILHKNQIWLATVNGLIRVDKPFIINKYNYLTSNDVQDICFFEDNIYVATTNGLNKIPLHVLAQKIEAPKMELSKYKSTVWNNIKNNKISLESDQNYLSIPIEIVNFLSPRNQIIEYRINQSNWTPIVNNSIDLLQISYGKTSIECRIKDVNSEWNTKKIELYKAYPIYLQTWFIVLFIVFILLLLYLFFQYKTKKLNIEKEKEIAQTTRIIELRQSALSAQMNPHFVFNSLNAIQYFVNSNQKEKSSEYLAKLSRLVRLFLHHASESFISLAEEVKRLQLYVNLEQLRFDNFECAFEIKNIEKPETILIPNMIVQPFIENAILHGVSHLATKDGRIKVLFELQNQLLTIIIEDNGFGIKNTTEQSSHISKGLQIIEERLQIMQTNNPNKTFSLHYEVPFPENERKGHRVVIQLTIDNS